MPGKHKFPGSKDPGPIEGSNKFISDLHTGYFRGRKTPAPLKGFPDQSSQPRTGISGVERPRPH